MKKLVCSLSLLFSLFCSPTNFAMEKEEISTHPFVLSSSKDTKGKKAALRIATYNIRRKGKDKAEHQWDKRRQSVIDLIKNRIKPDIFGLQEPIREQIDDFVKKLDGYAWFGKARSDTAEGWQIWNQIGNLFAANEYNPLFYNTNRIENLEHGTFNIHQSGDSLHGYNQTGWMSRICTWGLFQLKESRKKFYVYNTHLDHQHEHEEARINGITTILADIKTRTAKNNHPVILMGDLNTAYAGQLKVLLDQAGFAHAKDQAKQKSGPEYTSTGLENKELKTIDHILIKKSDEVAVQVKEHVVVETPGEYPSDHRPVYADLQFEK